MEKLIRQLNTVDSVTRREIEFFIERKLEEQTKIKGRIAKDLRRLGEDAFTEPRAYDKLREKYLRAHAGRKKLEILEMERQTWCK